MNASTVLIAVEHSHLIIWHSSFYYLFITCSDFCYKISISLWRKKKKIPRDKNYTNKTINERGHKAITLNAKYVQLWEDATRNTYTVTGLDNHRFKNRDKIAIMMNSVSTGLIKNYHIEKLLVFLIEIFIILFLLLKRRQQFRVFRPYLIFELCLNSSFMSAKNWDIRSLLFNFSITSYNNLFFFLNELVTITSMLLTRVSLFQSVLHKHYVYNLQENI